MAEATERSRRRAGKSSAAFRTISEVAQRLDVPQHVLRFWETKFSQVRPLKRGGGRRYYRPEDVALLERIRALLYDEGYTIKGVQRLLREGGAKAVAAEPVANGEATVAVETPAAAPAQVPEPQAVELPLMQAAGGPAVVMAAPVPTPALALSPTQRTTLEDLQSELKDLQGLLARLTD